MMKISCGILLSLLIAGSCTHAFVAPLAGRPSSLLAAGPPGRGPPGSDSYEDAIRAANGQVPLDQDTRVADRAPGRAPDIDKSKSGPLANSGKTRDMYNRAKLNKADAQGPNGNDHIALEDKSMVTVQGGALRTWSFKNHYVEKIQVILRTDGRPLNANVELWQGPDNCPHRMQVYVEDGSIRDFNAIIGTPGRFDLVLLLVAFGMHV